MRLGTTTHWLKVRVWVRSASVGQRRDFSSTPAPTGADSTQRVAWKWFLALTATLQYNLWKNVLSRLEFRWDHQAGDGEMLGYGRGDKRNSVLVAANLIYNF